MFVSLKESLLSSPIYIFFFTLIVYILRVLRKKWIVPAIEVLVKVKRLWIRDIVEQIPALGEMD